MLPHPDHPATYPRRTLLLVTGLSPQVVTETIFALALNATSAWVPTEVHVLTTGEGRERARLNLLAPSSGWFERLRADYALPPITFGETCLHVIENAAGISLSDIRSDADSKAAADALARLVARLTADDGSALHVSISGGRKTMGFLAGYTLSLFGRPQDRLSHVLVSARYESHPDFYYPTPDLRIIHTPPPDSRPLDTRDAEVTLADIPFVRLRPHLGETVAREDPQYASLVATVQASLGEPRLGIDLNRRRLRAGGQSIDLPPAPLALYAWLAWRRKHGSPPVACPIKDYPDHDYSAELIEVGGELLAVDDEARLRIHGLSHEQFTQWRSRLHARLKKQLGATAARPYEAIGYGRPPNYALHGLQPDQIHFEKIES